MQQQDTNAATNIAPILGLRVVLQRKDDDLCTCGSKIAVVGEGKAMHLASLRCACCDRFRGWAQTRFVNFALESVKQFGVPTTPLVLRNVENATSSQGADEAASDRAHNPNPNPNRKPMKISEKYPSRFMKADDLDGGDERVLISHAEDEEVGDGQKPVLYFKGRSKGLVLNKTNSVAIANAYGDETDNWTGKPLILFTVMVDFQGKTIPSIRCRAPRDKKQSPQQVAPAPDPDLNDEIPQFEY